MLRPAAKSLIILVVLITLASCRSHVAYVYSGMDPTVSSPSKTDPIYFTMPQNPSIKEKKFAILLKDELTRNGFNLVTDFGTSKWTLSFAIDRKTYTIGTTTHSTAVVFGAVVTGTADTRYVQQTDVTVFMNLFRTVDLEKEKPMPLWEGSVITKDRVFSVMPNSVIKNLLDRFGQNFDERPTRVDKNYQRGINAQHAQ